MLFVLTPSAIRNPGVLETPLARRVLGRGVAIRPRGGPLAAVFWRLALERPLSRYVIALAPFPVAMLIWPELALPISQAPILMFGIVLFIESNVLSVPTPDKRRALIGADEAARGLDLLRARAQQVLTGIAARRDLRAGTLHLVIEQSAMARVPPLTILSLQHADAGPPRVLELAPDEDRLLREALFYGALSESLLHRINLSQNVFVRDLPLEARSVSAHARLAALAARAPRLTARG